MKTKIFQKRKTCLFYPFLLNCLEKSNQLQDKLLKNRTPCPDTPGRAFCFGPQSLHCILLPNAFSPLNQATI